jgi:hypothetical protein
VFDPEIKKCLDSNHEDHTKEGNQVSRVLPGPRQSLLVNHMCKQTDRDRIEARNDGALSGRCESHSGQEENSIAKHPCQANQEKVAEILSTEEPPYADTGANHDYDEQDARSEEPEETNGHWGGNANDYLC